jgi:glycosyltransferase involved in cell wall biosynthesis
MRSCRSTLLSNTGTCGVPVLDRTDVRRPHVFEMHDGLAVGVNDHLAKLVKHFVDRAGGKWERGRQPPRRSSEAFRLTVVGNGGLRSELEAQTRSHGLESAVTFAGRVPNDDLPGIYAGHDVFCYPGRWDEPFGRVFLEALATGTPTVASDVGSVGDIVGDGGRTTDGTPHGFVDAILDLVRAGELRTVSEAATRKVEEYRAETVVPRFVELYERSLDG